MRKELYSGNGWIITQESAKNLNGVEKVITRAHGKSSVHIIAFNPDGTILLLREYRPFWKCWVWMLPSGKIDKESDPDVAAVRELREETGFTGDLTRYCICDYFENLSQISFVYVATNLHKDPLPQDADEMIELHSVSVDDAIDKVLASEKIHSASAYSLLRYRREHP